MNSQDSRSSLAFMSGGGEMGALLRKKDWTQTVLGAPEFWPSPLKYNIRLLLDNGTPMYFAWGPEYNQFYNDAFKNLLNTEDHLILLGSGTKEAFPSIWKSIVEPMFLKVLKGESTTYEDFPLSVIRNDILEENYFSFSLSPLRDEEGEFFGVIVFARDTTNKVLSEKTLQEERERLRLIIDKVPTFISYMDVSGRYQFANRRYSEWSARPLSEIEGFTRKDIISDSRTYEYLKNFEARAFAGEQVNFNLTLRQSNDEPIYLEMEYIPDIDPVTHAVKGIIHIGVDVTERKKVEESEGRYRSLTETLPQMMWASTPDGKINYANERCLRYTGITTQEKYGDVWTSMIHPHDLPHVYKAWQESMSKGTPFKEEYRMKRFDGEYRWFLGRALPVVGTNGIVLYWNGTATDIDDHKKIEKELAYAKENAENANATKTAFLANMSHEIRTPLGAILGFSELLKNNLLSSELRDQYIETITRNGQSLTKIIDDILDLAKVEAGRLEVEHIDFSLSGLLMEVIELLKGKAEQKGISLNLSLEKNVPQNIYSDPTRLRQIFINIIGNAVKFTDKGGIHVRVKSLQADDGTIKISVEVEDTGRGLTEEQKNRLFEPFTQADNTTTRQYGGTGLGLALSKRLSEALGGTITIEKFEQNVGCIFAISFIAMMGREAEKLASLSGNLHNLEELPLKGMNILFADDSVDNQFLVEYFLKENGASVTLANDGSEAVDKVLAGKYDLVLMDIQMPKMDGYQATKILIGRGCQVPIIALTAHAMDEEKEKTKAAGFVGHLTKPLNFAELLQTIIRFKLAKSSFNQKTFY